MAFVWGGERCAIFTVLEHDVLGVVSVESHIARWRPVDDAVGCVLHVSEVPLGRDPHRLAPQKSRST